MRRIALTAALLALCLPAAPAAEAQPPAAPAPAAAHPFYQRLLQEGIYALERGDHAAAVHDLQMAAFGFLDRPPLLAATLARLALAQGRLGDPAATGATLHRVLQLEERFGAYRESDLPPAQRRQFEDLLAQQLPEGVLSSVPAFRPLAQRKAVLRLEALPPESRRGELTALAGQEPREPEWRRLLAELELAAGRHPQALAQAQVLESLVPDDAAARCLRGRAAAGAGNCRLAIDGLESCAGARSDRALATSLLSCRVELAQWQEAGALLAGLPASIAGERPVRRLRREIERHQAAARASAPPAAPVAAPAEPAAPAGTVAAAVPAPHTNGSELPPGARDQLEEARRLSTTARRAGDLEAPLSIARAVADAYPRSREAQWLAGELAYRASRWQDAVAYLSHDGGPGEGEPHLLFYFAVALYESGQPDEAARALARALPHLRLTPLVESYRQKMLTP
jgi:tetratricopeptide (TPR) repeat protein